MQSELINLQIISPDKLIYKGQVEHVSSTNSEGNFDILIDHIPFVSIINSYISIKTADKKKLNYKINEAILHCKDNNVTIFTDVEKILLA